MSGTPGKTRAMNVFVVSGRWPVFCVGPCPCASFLEPRSFYDCRTYLRMLTFIKSPMATIIFTIEEPP